MDVFPQDLRHLLADDLCIDSLLSHWFQGDSEDRIPGQADARQQWLFVTLAFIR